MFISCNGILEFCIRNKLVFLLHVVPALLTHTCNHAVTPVLSPYTIFKEEEEEEGHQRAGLLCRLMWQLFLAEQWSVKVY